MKRYDIIYEDDYLIVVNKQPGVLVVPTPKKERDTLGDLLNMELDSRGYKVNAYPCHRIDRETSGLIIYAKGRSMQHRIMDLFKNRRIKKIYAAFAHGNIKKDFDTLKSYAYNKNKGRNELMITQYKVIERKDSFTVLELEPVTGRRNQIRIQLKEIGHPLVGESVYAFRKDFNLKFKRTALHAKCLRFTHPATGKLMDFVLPLPEDMKNFLISHRD